MTVLGIAQQTTSTVGTGSFTLDGASPSGQFGFAAVFEDQTCVPYFVTDGGSNWERGFGMLHTAGGVPFITRASVVKSSNSDQLVSFPAGDKTITASTADGVLADTTALATGIVKSTTGTGALSIAVAADFPPMAGNLVAAAGGTADAITATFSPSATLSDKMTVMVVCGSANATTTPSFTPNSLTTRTITAKGGGALWAGAIVGAGFVAILQYNLSGTRWELLNPQDTLASLGAAALGVAQTFTGAQNKSRTALTSTSNAVAVNLALNNDFTMAMTESTTLSNPTGGTAGQTGKIFISQHASSAKTLAFDTSWIERLTGSAPSLSTTTSARNILEYVYFDSTHIYYTLSTAGIA